MDYELLSARPAEVFALLYEFLGEEPYAHDFENVEYDAPQFDAQLGLDGLHRVHKQVSPRPRQTVLPPDLFRRYANMAFWRELEGSKAFRIVVQQPAEAPEQATEMPSSADSVAN